MSTDAPTGEGAEIIAFLDANIILEGKAPADLPWDEILNDGTIHALVVPQVMTEIDSKKRDGRLGPHARAFNRLIAPVLESGQPVVLREAEPRVELSLGTCNRISWDDYDELDPADGDSRLVAEALNARNVVSDRCVVVSHDIKPLAYAKGRGMQVHKVSDGWLRPIEPSPHDKEVQRLKQRLRDFETDEPTFEIEVEIEMLDGQPLTVFAFEDLDDDQGEELKLKIQAEYPRVQQNRDRFSMGPFDYDSSYGSRYDTYLRKGLPEFVSRFADKMQSMFNQRHLAVSVKNVGPVRADHLVIEVETAGGWLNDRLVFFSPHGPIPPAPRTGLSPFSPNIRDLIPARVNRHEFNFTQEPQRSEEMVATCEDLRSRAEFYWNGFIGISHVTRALEITVKITAANLRGVITETFRFEKRQVEMSVADVVDLETLQFKADFPLKLTLEGAMSEERFWEQIEWDKGGADDDDDD